MPLGELMETLEGARSAVLESKLPDAAKHKVAAHLGSAITALGNALDDLGEKYPKPRSDPTP